MRSSTFVCTLLSALLAIACDRSGVAEVSPDAAVETKSAPASASAPAPQAEEPAPRAAHGPVRQSPAAFTELPSYDRVLLERANLQARASGLEPGQRGCTTFSIVLVEALDSSSRGEADALIARYRDRGGCFNVDGGYSNSLFVGRLGDAGSEQLILEATGHDLEAARAIRAELDRQLGTRAPADCQLRELVEMVSE